MLTLKHESFEDSLKQNPELIELEVANISILMEYIELIIRIISIIGYFILIHIFLNHVSPEHIGMENFVYACIILPIKNLLKNLPSNTRIAISSFEFVVSKSTFIKNSTSTYFVDNIEDIRLGMEIKPWGPYLNYGTVVIGYKGIEFKLPNIKNYMGVYSALDKPGKQREYLERIKQKTKECVVIK